MDSPYLDHSELLEFEEPKAFQKAALIKQLQDGDFTLSYSSIQAFMVSPRHFIAYKVRERVETAAMLMGSVVHALVLEPKKVQDLYVVGPDVDATTAAGKNRWAEFYMDHTSLTLQKNGQDNYVIPKIADLCQTVKEYTGMTVLTAKVWAEAQFRARSICGNRACKWVLDMVTETEVDTPDDFELFGYKFKGRIDGQGLDIRLDIKNMRDASREQSSRLIQYSTMPMQAFVYEQAYGVADYYILAADPRGETCVHRLSRRMILEAGKKMEEVLTELERCIFKSFKEPEIWESSQDFWLRNSENPYGIHHFATT
jgi:hypothetical protein